MFSIGEYKAALESLAPAEDSLILRMLRRQYIAPEGKLRTPELAAALQLKSHGVVNLHYGKFGKRVASEIGKPLPVDPNGKVYGFEALSAFSILDGNFYWTMYPNLAKALEELKIV